MKKLLRIISGGQTGVDQAALKTGLEKGFLIGGWCPPGRICEAGIIPPEYPLIETLHDRSPNAPDVRHSQRTEKNVKDSDATLILKPEKTGNDPGTGWTILCAKHYNKSLIVIDPYAPDAKERILEWLDATIAEKLNVAGPSENTSPGVGKQTYKLLSEIF